ncbi:MAG TPA: glycosyltransferase family 2 protein [Chloroflexota bacterium]
MKSVSSLSMLGWALNEEANLAAYVDRAHAFLEAHADEYELVVVDDGSTDRTWDIARELQRTRPWLRPYRNDRNRGSGYNMKRAISLASKDYLLCQTVDWSYDIGKLGEALPLLQEYDLLQGVRPHESLLKGLLNGRSDNSYKAFISISNYLLVRVLFGMPAHDFQNVTVYPRALAQSLELESESAFTNPEGLLKAWWRGATVKEIPVPFLKRQKGKAKGTRPMTILRSTRDVLYWWYRWVVREGRPRKGRGRLVPYWAAG